MTYTDDDSFDTTDFRVVRFLDNREDLRWFYRAFDELGVVRAPSDGGQPCDPAAVLRCARENFGPCDVLW